MAVVDPFAGSCNALYWLLRHLPDADGLAFEADRTICQLTRRNLAHLDRAITLVEGDYRARLGEHAFPADLFLIVFVAPPWQPYSFKADSELELFSYSDRAGQEALGYWREQME